MTPKKTHSCAENNREGQVPPWPVSETDPGRRGSRPSLHAPSRPRGTTIRLNPSNPWPKNPLSPLCPLWQKNEFRQSAEGTAKGGIDPVGSNSEKFPEGATSSTESPLFRMRIQVPSATASAIT